MTRAINAPSLVAAMALVTFITPARVRACDGDCNGNGVVTVDELVRGVSIALGQANLDGCPESDRNGDGMVSVDELVAAVSYALAGCPKTPEPTVADTSSPTPSATGTPPPSPTITATSSPTAIATETATPSHTGTDTPSATASATATRTPSPTVTPTEELTPRSPTPTLAPGVLPIPDAVARSATGVALRLNQTVTTEGVITVNAGAFANNKLKVFAQYAERGILVFHSNSADVDAFQMGDRVRMTGVIHQEDATATDNRGIGTVMVDLTGGSWSVVSSGNPLPSPRQATLSEIVAQGVPYVGTLVRVRGTRKISGNWPTLGSKSMQVTITDDTGASLILRFQRYTITPALVDELNTIGNGAFDLVGIVVQDDTDGGADLLQGFEIWTRGADDIEPIA